MKASAAVLLAAAWLAGCATLPPPTAADNAISGRLAVQVAAHGNEPAHSASGAFDLRGNAEQGQLQLTSPIGTLMAQAHWRPGDVVLTTSDGDKHFHDLDALADDVLGDPVPLGALFDWLRGQPWAGTSSQPLPSPATGFEQLGWTVSLDKFADGLVVAHRDAAPAVTVRAKLSQP